MYILMQVYSHANRLLPPLCRAFRNVIRTYYYSTTAATAAKAPAAPIPITGPMCMAAPLAFVDALVVLPVCVCVPPPLEVVEPPFDSPFAPPVVEAVVDEGVDAVLVTEPAVIMTAR